MKKSIAVLLVMVLCFASVSFAEENWTCPRCGGANGNEDAFCEFCGAARPSEWVCPVCGRTNMNSFCGGCGTAKPDPTPVSVTVTMSAPEPASTPVPADTADAPYAVAESAPERFGIVQHIEVSGREVEAYEREVPISFRDGAEYAEVPGVITFRGGPTRKNSAYGVVDIKKNKMEVYAKIGVSSLNKGDTYSSGSKTWSGCGWTGQALIVQWDDDVRRGMTTLYDWARNEDGLVEVISPTEDGNVYFYELETGKKTRETLSFSIPFKGTGTVDPRGYPLLYIGSGDDYNAPKQRARALVVSLIDGKVLYEFGIQGEDSFAKRVWYAYDSAPLIDAKTDTLIWPGENGILYTVKLNTDYDPEAGTISVSPADMVKFRYDSPISYDQAANFDTADATHKWLGYEGSAAVWNGFLYISSNDGLFQCINLNTMQVVWVADTLDDTNASPVLEVVSETEAYLYVGTSLHFTQDRNKRGVTPFFKINAMTGEVVAQRDFNVETVSGVSGGIQASAALGEQGLEGLIYVPVARYGDKDGGVLLCLNKDTLETVWEVKMKKYAWSSPVLVYNENGTGYVIQADSGGVITLYDGLTGKELTKIQPDGKNGKVKYDGATFEATPAVFNNRMVLGSRSKIYLIELQ